MFDIQSITRAATVEQAIAALVADPESLPICGGSDLLIDIREGKRAGCSLVSIRDIPGLAGVSMEKDGTITIGPATTFAALTRSLIVEQHIPALGYAADQAGGPQLRNIGTVGGNICTGATSADTAPILLCLGAKLELTGPDGSRTVPLEEFYEGPGRVRKDRVELLTAIRVREGDYAGFTGHYIKYAVRDAMDIATLGCAVQVKAEGDRIADVRLAFGVAAPTPIRCHKAERAIVGRVPTAETLRLFSETALTEVTPRTSWRASREFRLQLVRELTARALSIALEKGGNTLWKS